MEDWIIDADNITRWEINLDTCERHILIYEFLSKANNYTMENFLEDNRVGCFEYNGFLVNITSNDGYDANILKQ